MKNPPARRFAPQRQRRIRPGEKVAASRRFHSRNLADNPILWKNAYMAGFADAMAAVTSTRQLGMAAKERPE